MSIKKIEKLGIRKENILEKESMANHTTFRIGGPADMFIICENEKELASLLKYVNENDKPHLILGNGSNILCSDDGYRGIVIKLGGDFEKIEVRGTVIKVGSGVLLSSASKAAADNGLKGMEFASGIPGSIGGAIYMNAGAYGGEMKDIVKAVRLMSPDGGEIKEYPCEEIGFAYRTSKIQQNGWIVLGTEIELEEGEESEIRNTMKELNKKRNDKQPVNFPSAGSTFKRPRGGYAAALIEEAGLKGFSVGGAEVSSKHSGFVVNKGGATCSDVIALMEKVKTAVYDKSGIVLEPEVRIIGDVK